MCTSLRVLMISSIPPSKNVLRMMSAQSTSLLLNSVSAVFNALSILISLAGVGYACSKVTGNLSRNASLSTLVPTNLPSSEPLPLVLAVATTVKPAVGLTYLPIFLRKTPLPSSIDCKHRILLDARSISSSNRTAPR